MKRHASLNRIYRLVWSHAHNAWIAVAETALGRGKMGRSRLVAAALALSAGPAWGTPVGGVPTAGSGDISQSGDTTTIAQHSQYLAIKWQSFDTAAGETVRFVQPSASAIAVNRIYDTNGTRFFGHLDANGQVFLINPNGILFGPSAQVNVGGLVASTLDASDASLSNAVRSFSGSGVGSVVNQGTISGRYVALLGNTVSNQGTIAASRGTVALGAGSAVTLTFADDNLVRMQVDRSTLDNLAENGGLIQADGGMVLLSAGAKDAVLASVVNNTGVIEARSVRDVNGTIVLDGGAAGSATNSGTLDASGKGAGETGGTVKVLGGTVDLAAGSRIDVSGDAGGGTALIGGNFHGAGPEQNATTTNVAAGASIDADAITRGRGGNIAVWSNEHTTVDGTFSARGGAEGGNGGQVETSGKKLTVGSGTRVNTLAPTGTAGNWLLDPSDFVIYGAGGSGDMLDSILSTNLGSGNVTILSSTGGSGSNGDIIVNSDAAPYWTSSNTLTLSAFRDVTVNGWLWADGAGNIVLRADNTGIGSGKLNVGGSSYISSTTGATDIYYNPTSYASPTNYAATYAGNIFGTVHEYMLLRIIASVQDKTYDGTTAATLSGAASISGPDGSSVGQRVSLNIASGTATFSDKNVGTGKTVTLGGYSLTGADAGLYYLNGLDAQTASITAKALTESGLSVAASKTYDGTTAATLSGAAALQSAEAPGAGTTSDGKPYTGDTVSLTGTATGTYNSKDVATASSVTYGGLSLTGAQSGNYTLTMQGDSAATITQKALTESGLSVAASKTYDGTTAATLSGAAALQSAEAPGAGTTSDGKPYTGDTVSLTGTATGTYNSKDVATASSVSYGGLSLIGAQSGNYTLTMQGDSAATITQKALTESGLSVAASKTYDGTTAATLSGAAALQSAEAPGAGTTSDGKPYTGDTVSLTGTATGTYNSKDVATASSVSYGGLSLTGAQSGNYTLTIQGDSAATITAKALTESGLSVAASKTYDGTTSATLSGAAALQSAEAPGAGTTSDGKPYTSDTVSLTGTATGTYNSKNVGIASSVTYGGLSLTGAQSGNYTLTLQGDSAATITARSVTLTAPNVSKTYDGGLTYTATAGDLTALGGSLVGSDTVTAATIAYTDKNAGAGSKTVNLNAATISDGNGGANYSVTLAGNSTSTITQRSVTLTAPSVSKVYDAGLTYTTTAGDLTALGGSLVGSDTVTAATIAYTDKNVGAGSKTVNLNAATVSDGNGGANYSVTLAGNSTSTITAAPLTLGGITASNKVYDGTTAATLNTAGVTFTGLLGSDAVTLGGTGVGNFADKNVGTGKTVTVSGYALGGADAGNYTVAQPTGLAADITAKALTESGLSVAASKTYDGTTAATLLGAAALQSAEAPGAGTTSDGKPYTGDTISLTGTATGTYNSKNVGVASSVSYGGLSLTGADAGNYTLTIQSNSAATITAKPVTLTAPSVTKSYDGGLAYTTTAGDLTALSGSLVGSDTVTAATLAYTDKNVGAGSKTVNLNAATISDGNGGANYSVTLAGNGTSSITPVPLTVIADDASKTYDGAPYSGGNGVAYSGFVGGETATVLGGTLTYGGSSQGATSVGSYVITPGGLTSTNYTLSFVDGTLTISAAPAVATAPPQPVQNAVTEVQATLLPPEATTQAQTLVASSTITVSQGTGSEPPADGQGDAGTGTGSPVNTVLDFGGNGPSLQIVNGGVRLPLTLLNPPD